jgi:hypothetical protein
MFLNDQANNEVRQQLLPFVMRLACADSEEVEQQRQTYIFSEMIPFMSMSKGIEVLEGALAIGRQADPIALPVVKERISVAKEKGGAATPKAKEPLFATVKKLLDAL